MLVLLVFGIKRRLHLQVKLPSGCFKLFAFVPFEPVALLVADLLCPHHSLLGGLELHDLPSVLSLDLFLFVIYQGLYWFLFLFLFGFVIHPAIFFILEGSPFDEQSHSAVCELPGHLVRYKLGVFLIGSLGWDSFIKDLLEVAGSVVVEEYHIDVWERFSKVPIQLFWRN